MPVIDLNMSFDIFKSKLEKHLWKLALLNHFDDNNNCTLYYQCMSLRVYSYTSQILCMVLYLISRCDTIKIIT